MIERFSNTDSEYETQKFRKKRDNLMGFVITIDGPAASGKSSVSRELAKRLDCEWVSTGSFYRGLAYVAQQTEANLEDEKEIAELAQSDIWSVEIQPDTSHVFFKGNDVTKEIHHESVGLVASRISQYPGVRKMLLGAQRECRSDRGLVAEGRDCGSVVFPDADLKIYLDADTSNRAERRAQQNGLSKEDIEKLQKVRDNQDLTRSVAPLMTPEGAHVIDTSTMTLLEVVDTIERLFVPVLASLNR